MKRKARIKLSKACLERWMVLYGSAVVSRFTVECVECGAVAVGDKPVILITCTICFAKADRLAMSQSVPLSPEATDSPRRLTTPRGSDSQDGDGARP